MQYTIFVLLAVLYTATSMSNAFLKGAGRTKAPSSPKAVAPKAAAPTAPTSTPKRKKDMTWGGRPDPTPELYVDETKDAGNWLNAGWRYNKRN